MKRLKVVIVRDPVMDLAGTNTIHGLPAKLVDADTGDAIDCVQDFSINVPMDDIITVDVRMTVSEIEVRPGLPVELVAKGSPKD